jgi:hypothetical protein
MKFKNCVNVRCSGNTILEKCPGSDDELHHCDDCGTIFPEDEGNYCDLCEDFWCNDWIDRFIIMDCPFHQQHYRIKLICEECFSQHSDYWCTNDYCSCHQKVFGDS